MYFTVILFSLHTLTFVKFSSTPNVLPGHLVAVQETNNGFLRIWRENSSCWSDWCSLEHDESEKVVTFQWFRPQHDEKMLQNFNLIARLFIRTTLKNAFHFFRLIYQLNYYVR